MPSCLRAQPTAHDTVSQDTHSFGKYIRALRQHAALKLTEMASLCGVSPSHYGRIESGDKAPIDPTRWASLMDIGADRRLLEDLLAEYKRDRRAARRSRRKAERDAVPPGKPGSSSWEDLSWEDDDWCWYAVSCHPDGLTIEEIGALTGLSAERVRQIEIEALAKLEVEVGAVEAMEVIEDRDSELAIWTVAAAMR